MPQFNFTSTGFSTVDTSSGLENLLPQVNRPNICTLSQGFNVRFTQEGGVRNRNGYTVVEDVGSSAKIDSCQALQKYGVSFWRSGTKIYQGRKADIDNSISYDIGVTRTATEGDFLFPHERWIFATNSTDSYLRIAVGVLTANAETTDNRIKVDNILTFIGDFWSGTYTGTVYIRGIAVTYDQETVFTADHTTETFTSTGHGLENGVIVRVTTGGTLPSGLSEGTDYYIINKTANTFQVSLTSGGSAVAIADNGSGTHKFKANDNWIRNTSGETGAMVTGDIITQTTTDSAAPKATCIAELDGSALVAKDSTLTASLPETDAEPENFYNFNLSQGATAKRLSSDITALKTGNRVVLIGMKQGIDVATGFEPNSGALLTSPLTRNHSIPNANCIAEMERAFAALTSDGRILLFSNTDAGFQLVEDPHNRNKNFDYPMQGYIQKNKDQNDNSQNFLHYDPVTKELSATILMTNGITEEIVCQTDIGAWSVDQGKTFSCKVNLEGRVYGGSDSDDKIILDDEGTTHNGTPFTSRIVTGRFRLGRKGVSGDYLGLNYGGLLSGQGEFVQRLIVNDITTEELVTAEDLQNEGLMSVSSGVPLGSGTVGAETIGSGGTYTEAFGFEYPYEFMAEGEYAQLELEITDEGTKAEFRFFDLFGETEGELLLNHQ